VQVIDIAHFLQHCLTKFEAVSDEQAGFAVLKAPDIPSILVETAFISNVEEERKLKTKARLLYPVLVQVIDIAHFLQHCLTKFEAVSDGEACTRTG
jgi:hypothetical protein